MAETMVMVYAPDGTVSEMTESGAQNYKYILEEQGKDSGQWRFVRKDSSETGEPQKTISYQERTVAQVKVTLEDLHTLMGDIYMKLTKIETDLAKNKGGRPKKQLNA